MKLQISKDISLPLDAVTQTFALLAKRGSGKSYTASVMAEEMLKASQQIVALDPTGAWYGLRSGFPVVIFGGEHADVPLEESAGEVVARAIVENGFSAILDLSLFRKGQMIRFMVAFAETLYRLNRQPLHLFVDEADAVAPQMKNYGGDENRMLGAMEDIVRRGRKRGIGCTLITQRPAVLNKNVLTQCEILISLRLVHPKDINAIEEWVNVHGDPKVADTMIASLPSLPIGTAWIWAPGWGDIFQKVEIRKRETFDSGATPKPGEATKRPGKMREIDIAALGQAIQDTIEKAERNDPAELKRTIVDLKRKLEKAEQSAPKAEQKHIEVPVFDAACQQLLEKVQEVCGEVLKSTQERAEELANINRWLIEARVRAGRTVERHLIDWQHHQTKRTIESLAKGEHGPIQSIPRAERFYREKSQAPSTSNGEVSGGMRRMMIVLAQRPGLTKKQLGVRAGLSSRSGTFGTYMSSLRSSGYMTANEPFQLTDEGHKALGQYDPLPSGRALLDFWLRHESGGVARMLSVLANAYPDSLSKQELGERAEISSTSGTFGTYISRLRTLELAEGPSSALRANPELFE